MPDWTYRTVFRPLLFALGPDTGRRLAFGAMGTLARLPLGRSVIRFMGHMSPPRAIGTEWAGQEFVSPVGIGCRLDSRLQASSALAEFGIGFLEVGPVVATPASEQPKIAIDTGAEAICFETPPGGVAASEVQAHLKCDRPLGVAVWARIEPQTADQAEQMLEVLKDSVQALVVPLDSMGCCDRSGCGLPVLLALSLDQWRDRKPDCLELCTRSDVAGVIVEGDDSKLGRPIVEAGQQAVREIRSAVGEDRVVVAAAGIHTPEDALNAVQNGATFVKIDTGMVFAGPGLPKRINAALLYETMLQQPEPTRPLRLGSEAWLWAFLMGLSMFLGGLLAMAVATTRVVLPYDELMAGLSREELGQINDRLLDFMTHDRVTLAGTMLAVGILYMSLAWSGIRNGLRWARTAVAASAMAGFFSFFSFLGFGYFDPFHAFVTAILFQFLLLTIHAPVPDRVRMEAPALWNDRRWLTAQWGQLLFVIHGAILIVAGTVISVIGMTSVFVPEDLEFMHTSAADLFGAHPQLVPLVAHDRATFGGMLLSCGAATLLPALWGFQRGQRWLWWSLLLGGSVAYWATMLVHWKVGYHSLKHLLPAYGGLALLWVSAAASYGHLVARDTRLESAWSERRQRLHSRDPV